MLYLNQGNEEEAYKCFQISASHGNSFAKQQVVCLNPYAALCNKMLNDMFKSLREGESVWKSALRNNFSFLKNLNLMRCDFRNKILKNFEIKIFLNMFISVFVYFFLKMVHIMV